MIFSKAGAMRFGITSLLVLVIINLRLFWIPGFEFNTKNWDDEIRWINDSQSRSALEFISYRDAPGYFVFIPRLLILIGDLNPSILSLSSLRVLVLLIHLICISFAVACVVSFSEKWRLWLILFSTLSLTYVEDLNYIHNVGYLFIFPIYFLVFKRFSEKKVIPFYLLFVACLLISKPFTAVIVLSLVLLFLFSNRSLEKKLLALGAYSLTYLLCYFVLPHRWETPFNSDPFTLVKILIDLPWIVFATLFPSLYIGAMSAIRIFEIPELRLVVGLALNLMAIGTVYAFRSKLVDIFRGVSLNTKGLILIFVINYVLVFSASDSFWIKHFPLYLMDSPWFLWARWSAVLPFALMLIIGSLHRLNDVLKRNIYFAVSAQWVVLLIAGNSWLRRYW
jgi:hypothetical protein